MSYLTTETISYLDTLKNNIYKTTGKYLTDQQTIKFALEYTFQHGKLQSTNMLPQTKPCAWQHARG